MGFLTLVPVFISFLLLVAHFVRAAQIVTVVVLLLLLLLMFVRKYWVPWVIQVTLILGTIEWLATLYRFAQMRIASDMPWARMAVILGAVALFTALSSLVFRTRTLRNWFQNP